MVLKSKVKSIGKKVGEGALGAGKLALAVAKKSPVGTALAVGGLALGATKLLGRKGKGGKSTRRRSVGYWKRKTALLKAKKEYVKTRGY